MWVIYHIINWILDKAVYFIIKKFLIKILTKTILLTDGKLCIIVKANLSRMQF